MTVSPELDARFREAAAAEGLLDVAYDLVDTPVGQLLVAVTDRGLCEVSFDPEPEREVETLARNFGARVLRSPRPTDEARRQLDEYFAGERQRFDLPVDLRLAREFAVMPAEVESQVEELIADLATRRLVAFDQADGSPPIPGHE